MAQIEDFSKPQKELADAIASLQQTIVSQNEKLIESEQYFSSLKDDFLFNLSLLTERDKELSLLDLCLQKEKDNLAL
ncbi:hypothetical protein HK096_008045, partial [Nowakowskiella sp. JEL0078]